MCKILICDCIDLGNIMRIVSMWNKWSTVVKVVDYRDWNSTIPSGE